MRLCSRPSALLVQLSLVGAMISGLSVACLAQQTPATPPPAGLRESVPAVHALVGGRIVFAPGKSIDKGTLVVRNGVIEAVGESSQVAVPPDARTWDASGKTIYPGLIDAYAELAAPSAAPNAASGAPYWNSNVAPQVRADELYVPDAEVNRKLRSQGVTARLVAPAGGIIKGASAVVSTSDENSRQAILRGQVALHAKLTPARDSAEPYPNSPMGAFTLVRQAFYDAQWYRDAWDEYAKQAGLPRPERNDALAAMRAFLGGESTVIVDATDELYFLRADQIAAEFKLKLIVRGSGYEYRRLDAVAKAKRPVILPLNFPRAPNVATPEAALDVTLERLMHWDIAPENPGRLDEAGVAIAFTSAGLSDVGGFLDAVRKAVERGLKPEAALKALTTTPAEWFGLSDRLGTLDKGRIAHFVVADGDLFAKKTRLVETWVDGQRFELRAAAPADLRGTWEASIAPPGGSAETVILKFDGQPEQLKGKLLRGDREVEFTQVSFDNGQLNLSLKGEPLGLSGVIRISATLVLAPAEGGQEQQAPRLVGDVFWADGGKIAFEARRTAAHVPPPEPKADEPKPAAEKKAEEPPASTTDTANAPATKTGAPAAAAADAPRSGADGDARRSRGEGSKPAKALYPVNFPLGEFGVDAPPEQPERLVLRGATIWTSGPAGVLENATLVVEQGKITAVGKDVKIPDNAVVIDAAGKHVSAGIIDCHSHIATDGGVNESGQTSTGEVRIGDFIDANDISIYRQLAGGVTAANILHGSANTIGGQNQVIKFRWGALPEEIKFREAPPGIKFALGENVKRSNSPERSPARYPQTRQGVEQLLRDSFQAAVDYRSRWDQWNQQHTGLPPRVDLELEALSEVVAGKRWIHCHSYRQDEILALLRSCEAFGVKIATLQHILEGYKVADAMAKHGVGGSSFADWWTYKIEVYDAIPYNGAVMHNAGVIVSFNSDDAELARRLNLEAAKAVKYGGVPPVEALKFVTLNPARQLRIDARVGSLEVGKDADFVVWSGSPLSTLSRCEQTWIDGRKYFDREEDMKRREQASKRHAALVQRVIDSGAASEGTDEGDTREQWARHDEFCRHGHGHDEDGLE